QYLYFSCFHLKCKTFCFCYDEIDLLINLLSTCQELFKYLNCRFNIATEQQNVWNVIKLDCITFFV
ncbi:hypothetical protein FF38_04572, partial [Lucilia cuprina]